MRDRLSGVKYAVLAILSALWIFPLFWAVSISFMREVESVRWPLSFIPREIIFDAYRYIFTDPQANVAGWLTNSMLNAVLYTVLVLIVCALAAYPLARFTFPGRDATFLLLLSTMMIPGIINLVPLYATVSSLGLIGSRFSLILPGVPTVLGLFLLRQFFLNIPKEMEEAAVLDGAGHFRFFYTVLLPLTKPSLVVLGLTSFLANWNDYLWPSIAITGKRMETITIGLSIIRGQYTSHLPRMMAVTVVSLVLPISLFIVFRKQLLKGIDMSTAIK